MALATLTTLEFELPTAVANRDVYALIFSNQDNKYLDASGSYETISPGADVLIPLATGGGYAQPVTASVDIPADHSLNSGVVYLFVGSSPTILFNGNTINSPTVTTNPDDVFGLFEMDYVKGGILDVDISEVDQLGFPFQVASPSGDPPGSTTPFPLTLVGMTPTRGTLFREFTTAFPAAGGSPFAQVAEVFPKVRLTAPQTILSIEAQGPQQVVATQLNSQGGSFTPGTNYWYVVTAQSDNVVPDSGGILGESVPSDRVLSGVVQPGFNSVQLTWQPLYAGDDPTIARYNVYRAEGPTGTAPKSFTYVGTVDADTLTFVDLGGTPPTPPATTLATISPFAHSNYGFNPLSHYFTESIQQFFDHYAHKTFEFYDTGNQIAWQGQTVSDYQGQAHSGTAVTASATSIALDSNASYFDNAYNGLTITVTTAPNTTTSATVTAYDGETNVATIGSWSNGTPSAGDAFVITASYTVLQLTAQDVAGASSDFVGETVNVYAPFFLENTRFLQVNGATPPPMPSWLTGYSFNVLQGSQTPGEMTFGNEGVFNSGAQDPTTNSNNLAGPISDLENPIVSALNRGLATTFTLPPNHWAQAPIATALPEVATNAASALPAATYYYAVTALGLDGETTPSLIQPATVTGTPGTSGAQQVTLNWLQENAAARVSGVSGLNGTTLTFITAQDHGLHDNVQVYITGVELGDGGNADAINTGPFAVTNAAARTFEITVASAPDGTYAFGGLVSLVPLVQASAAYAFNIYRGTSPDQLQYLDTVLNATGAQATTFTDAGRLSPSGSGPPFVLYPRGAVFNEYARFLHRNSTTDSDHGISINGLVYGFPFDDQEGQSTNVEYLQNPSTITIAVNDFGLLGVTAPPTATAGQAFGVTVAAEANAQLSFTSSDPLAVLPPSQAFDPSQPNFSVTLKTAGPQTLTVTDEVGNQMTVNIDVTPASTATRFVFASMPARVRRDGTFSFIIKAVDATGAVDPYYRGTVRVTCNDPRFTPFSYTFSTADQGRHTFKGLKLQTKGTWQVVVKDTTKSSLRGVSPPISVYTSLG